MSKFTDIFTNLLNSPKANLITDSEIKEIISKNEAFKELFPSGLFSRMESVLDDVSMSKVINVFSSAEVGNLGDMISFYEKMESSDSRLRAVIRNRRISASRVPFQLTLSTDASNNTEAIKARDLVLSNIERLHWSNTLQDLLDGRMYGVAVFEKVWNKSVNGDLFIEKVNQIEPMRIEQDMDSTGALGTKSESTNWGELRIIFSDGSKEYIKNLPRYKIITAVNTTKKGKYDLAGVLRPIARWFVIKTLVAKMWAQYAERYGFPFITVTVNKSDYDTYKSEIKKLIESAGANRWGIFWDNINVDVTSLGATGSTEVFEKLINTCNSEMVIGVLGQSLTTDVGDSGSRALGDVHKEVKDEISEDDNNWIDEIINQQFVFDIVKHNFPNLPVELYPVYETKRQKEVDLRAFSEGVRAFTRLAPVSLDWIYEQSQVPKPDPKEDVIGGYGTSTGDPLLDALNDAN